MSSTQSESPFIATRAQPSAPIRGQLEFPLTLECPECWMPPPAHMYYCKHAKLTERQRMMS